MLQSSYCIYQQIDNSFALSPKQSRILFNPPSQRYIRQPAGHSAIQRRDCVQLSSQNTQRKISMNIPLQKEQLHDVKQGENIDDQKLNLLVQKIQKLSERLTYVQQQVQENQKKQCFPLAASEVKIVRVGQQRNTIQQTVADRSICLGKNPKLVHVNNDSIKTSPIRVFLHNSSTESMRDKKELVEIENKMQILKKRKEYLQATQTDVSTTSSSVFMVFKGKKSQQSPQNCVHQKLPQTLTRQKDDKMNQQPKNKFVTLCDNIGKLVYEGDVEGNKYHGRGRLFNNYFQQIDNFIELLPSLIIGQTSYYWSLYEGFFKNGSFNGLGTLFIGEKYKLNGNFQEGRADGQITIINKEKYL